MYDRDVGLFQQVNLMLTLLSIHSEVSGDIHSVAMIVVTIDDDDIGYDDDDDDDDD